MKLTVHRASPQHGHETLVMEPTDTRELFTEFNIVAVAGQIVKDYSALQARVSDLEAEGVTEAEVFVAPKIMGG